MSKHSSKAVTEVLPVFIIQRMTLDTPPLRQLVEPSAFRVRSCDVTVPMAFSR